MLSRSSAQEAALNKYLAELQDKSSPNYHKWLTPAQFGKLYGPADSDVAAIVAWLQSQGLRVDGVSSGRTNIAFSGSVAQIERALHTSIHSYQANGEQFFSNNSNPKIPAALAGASGLHG
jgi:subtilase family serine protease